MAKKAVIWSVSILLAAIILIFAISRRGEPVVVETNLEKLPMTIGGLTGTEDFFSDAVYKELNADKHVYRHYRGGDGKEVSLYIGYYGTAKGGRTGHNPYGCLPGAGWGIVESRRVEVNSKLNPNGVYINHVLARKGDRHETSFHWYQSAGTKVLSNGIQQNIERFKGRILYNRNDGAFISVSMVTDEKGVEKAFLLGKAFSEKVLDLIPSYWPVEK
jgi:EpsI family protein